MARLQAKRVDGRFVNPQLAPAPGVGQEAGWREFLKWRRERVKPPKEFHVPRVARTPDRLPRAPDEGVAATWVGHSTVVLQVDGKTYLTDPVWSARIGHGTVKRRTPPGIPWTSLPLVDAVLLSHNHYDHLDLPTLGLLPRDTPVFCPAGVGAWLARRGWTRVVERAWWESEKLDGHRLTLVPAQHFSGRTLWDRDRTLWGGWVVEGDAGSRAWFAGDTGWFDALHEIGDAFPRLDLALVPVGAYEPRWFMSPVHVDPQQAGEAFLASRARRMLPVHWGTFLLADEPIDAPPGVLRAWWEETGLDPERLLLPALGETATVPKA